MHKKLKKKKLIIILVLLAIGVIYIMLNQAEQFDMSHINEKNYLNNKIFTGDVSDKNLLIENKHIKNTTFHDFKAYRSTFKNVIFENCTFEGANFYESDFENIQFLGGKMTRRTELKEHDYNTNGNTIFTNSTFKNLLIDGTKLNGVAMNGIKGVGSKLIIKNIKDSKNKEVNRNLGFSNMHLHLDNCEVYSTIARVHGKNSSIYATNNKLFNASFSGSNAKVMYIENCTIKYGSTANVELVIVKNSKLSNFGGGGQKTKEFYLENNTFFVDEEGGGLSFKGGEETKIHLSGGGEEVNKIVISGANTYISNLNIKYLLISKARTPDLPLPSVNFKNVNILEGGRFYNLILKTGQWQNVKIYPPIEISNVKIENLNVHNVSFPKGTPWVNADEQSTINVTESKIPFEWPEIKIPTIEELSLNTSLTLDD